MALKKRTKSASDREFVTALARGLTVIQIFDRDHPELTLSQVAAKTGLSAATARRFLWTLRELGYVGMEEKRFFLKPKVVSLGSAYLDAGRVEEVVLPFLREIVAETGDSSSLAILENDEVLYVANFSSQRRVRLTAGVGARFPAYAVSIGRVLLAALEPHEIDAYFARVKPTSLTPTTVTQKSQLKRILKQVKVDGYSAVIDDLEEGLGAVAVPIRLNDKVIAGLNCSAFAPRATEEEIIAKRVPILKRVAGALEDAVRRVPALSRSFSRQEAE
jgi:IclR family transcriptional regulator, pca regulon regulatory protein